MWRQRCGVLWEDMEEGVIWVRVDEKCKRRLKYRGAIFRHWVWWKLTQK